MWTSGPAPDMQEALAKATYELVGHVRRQNLGQIVERATDHRGKLMCRSLSRPPASQIQAALALFVCLHSSKGPGERMTGRAGALRTPQTGAGGIIRSAEAHDPI